MTAADGSTIAEAEIRALIEEQAQAIRANDVGGSVSSYAADESAAEWFSSFRGPIGYDVRDLAIAAADDVAFCHGLKRVRATTKTGQRLDMWWRATICYRKVDGAWRVTHEHASVPFNVASGRVSLDLEP